MGRLSRRHDRELLDALESRPSEEFSGETWRVTVKGRDALRGSTAGGHWSPPGEFEVLYTSLAREGALAETGYRLSLEPVWPSRLEHQLHRITVRTNKSLRFADVNSLSTLGVDVRRYASFDYSVTQAIAAAVFFLDFDGLIVPSARSTDLGARSLEAESSESVNRARERQKLHNDCVNLTRSWCNLVIFTEKLDVGELLKLEASEPVDWSLWRSQHRR